MNELQPALLARFAHGPTIADRWTAARELMANRQLVSITETDEFKSGFGAIGEEAAVGSAMARLIAVDLVVRLSRFVKRLSPVAENILRKALADELPPASLLGESKALPDGAKPAELRENVAIALQYASGDWVVPYVVRALVEEDRSQRCRLELARQLVSREQSIDRWLSWIVDLPLQEIVHPRNNVENAATRLRDITAALADAIKQKRVQLSVSESSGIHLAKLCRILVPVSLNSSVPKRLSAGAAAAARLLDEIFAVQLTLIVEPETYAVLETFERWWQPLPYPKSLRDALLPIVDKLVTGITLRARWGQRSDSLATRLRQSFGDRDAAAQRLKQIAETETGLPVEIDDWLRGRSRKMHETTNLASSLRAVSNEELTDAIAPLLLDAEEALDGLSQNIASDSAHHLRRLAAAIKSLASQRGLEIVGSQGEAVEYLPLAHQTVSGKAPADPWVQVIRPMVVRRRRDGSEDIVVRAIVTEAN